MNNRYVILGLLVVLGPVVACDEGTIAEKDAREFVDQWAERAEESVDEQVPADDAAARFESLAEEAAEADENRVSRTEPPYDVFIRDVYADLGWELRLAGDEGMTDRGESVWSVLEKADAHALDMEHFEFDAIRKRVDRIETLDEQVAQLDSYSPTDEERSAAVDWLTRQQRSDFELAPENFDRLVEAVIASESGDQLADHMEDLEDVYGEWADTVAELEQLLARNAVRYSRKMKHFRIRHLFIHPRHDDYWSDPVIEEERPDEALGSYRAGQIRRRAAKVADEIKEPVAMLHRRMRETLREMLTADDPVAVFEGLEPDHPQYAQLKEEYERYRDIVADGGWESIDPVHHLRRGSTHGTVAALKKRLQTEGYYPADADTDETFDEPLEEAIEAYQKTHQLKVSGKPHRVFWLSLNKDAEYRMRQVGLNLRRWRESNVRHSDPTYAMVNIPGFTVSLFHEQERKMHFEIVVGNDDISVDEETNEKSKPNHTPELSAYIDRVIYNPFWNVTDRIRNGELLPKVRHSLEEKYKAKLREMRREVRGIADASKKKSAFDVSQYFVASNSDGGSSTGTGSTDEASVSAGPLAGPSESDEDDQSEPDSEETSEPKVPIDDLFRMVDVKNQADDVDQQTIFDAQKVRELVEKYQSDDSDEVSPTGGGLFGNVGASAASASSPDTSEASSDEEPTSPLEEKFPYLDPTTGKVDVSATDPDNVPSWYEENDYEVMFPGKKWEYIRMTQGDHNALGRVKVIFPNQHAVYLHDTPKKALFSRNIRAFSHGCMRMKKPLEFAKTLLEIDGGFDEVNVPKLLEGEEKPVKDDDGEPTGETEIKYTYKPVFLDRQVPVHVEYFTVLVGDEGRANFYADIYNKDRRKLDPDFVPEVDRDSG